MRVTMPSERKFEIYHAVQTEHLSRREAARRFKLSPTRVQQMVMEVRAFVLEHGSESTLNMEPDQLELASLRLGYEKLCFYEQRLMRQWTAAESSASMQGLAVRLMQASARIVIEQTKLAGRIAKVQKEMLEEGTFEAAQHSYVLEDDDDEETEHSEASPPEEDCTEDDPPMSAEEERMINEIIASLGPNATSDQIFQATLLRGAQMKPENTPAQLGLFVADAASIGRPTVD
jgi:hypothetical protein